MTDAINLLLPDETKNSDETVARFRQDFRFTAELLAIAVEFAEEYCRSNEHGYMPITKGVIGSILSREIRRFRSILLLSERSFVENAEILTRSLFEGLLGERFILFDPIPESECSSGLLGQRNRLPPIPDDFSEEEFRGYLYASLPNIKLYSLAVDGIDLEQIEAVQANFAEIEKMLGSEWTQILQRRPRTFSGLSVKDLAENCGLKGVYEHIYSFQSSEVHAADGLAFLDGEDEHETPTISLMIGTPDRRVAQVPTILRIALGIFATLLADIGGAFSIDKSRLDALRARYEVFVKEDTND